MSKTSQLLERLKNIQMLVMDVDGTLTDSAMYYSENGEELKRFSTRDGMGITLLRKGGLKTGIITSENSKIVTSRAEKLKIDYVILGSKDKSSDLMNISEESKIKLSNIAYIGDDINDYHIMKLAGFSACPKDAVKLIKKTADYICKNKGGYGAVREFSEKILIAQNKPISINEQW